MIVVDKPKLKFLLAGRTISVTVHHDRYRRGRSYAVGTKHNRPAPCRATVQGIRVTSEGWELEIVQNREDQPWLLARNPGGQRRDYVTRPADAAAGEPEAIDAAAQRRYSKDGRERDKERQRAQRAETPIEERVRALQQRAESGDRQAQRHFFMVKKHLEEDAKREARGAA